jgi:hypothetical protein
VKRSRAKAKPADEPVPADGAEAPAAKPKRAKKAAPEEVSS